MKTTKFLAGIAAAGALTLGTGLPVASADDNATQAKRIGQLDERLTGTNVRVSQLIGMDIQNDRGEGVGEINDVVIDAATGKIKYAAVTYGGFLGLGDKLFAVPFDALQVKRNPDDPGDRGDLVFILNVTQKQMEGAVGFDQYHWPNFADKNFTRDLEKRYETNRRDRTRTGGVDVNVDRNGVDVDVRRDRDE
ncbi:PRC-barrel domain protein [Rosistilla carotiformis]|uniref:PRC-barrel domain protein n=1 Tax=Rosistilla carotiformis TaxID=2528017 RepID=A0A518JVB1_9BACT|nr:PRC-barrel domain-containing protein [Rosistilla carotiformis]QDV69480.1 PRC-barrel domain protein [Rosistilla carotiformis]